MARQDDAWKIRRDYERRKEREAEEDAKNRPAAGMVRGDNGQDVSEKFIDKLDEYMKRAEPLIMQINSSYNQWVAGVEQQQPLERINQLEQLMSTLQVMAKPTESYRYRYAALLGSYHTYQKRWQKLVMDVEAGRIKRVVQRRSSGF